MGKNFVMDKDFEAAVKRTDEVHDLLLDKATDAAEVARGLAPDDPNTDDDLKASIYADVAMTDDGWRGRVGATDFKAGWKEYGTSREAAKPYLRPAVEQVVGPLEADPDGPDA